ncbi:hypothetical protein GCM10010172_26560 [Paractinoplanes ferrugineus]|uniref:Uncharacterized protein n=1 Tax=Paractinoplanes ferrugineus TaxID=113564 RepID=A0A919MBI3_9ACTN|nr:hypothetical protein Afe05nite_02740 [Actinoplanes ferrugineus]
MIAALRTPVIDSVVSCGVLNAYSPQPVGESLKRNQAEKGGRREPGRPVRQCVASAASQPRNSTAISSG